MAPSSLPAAVIRKDHELDERQSKAAGELCRLRWQWTLDPGHPDAAERKTTHGETIKSAVTFADYARAVGREPSRIRADARAYALLTDTGRSRSDDPRGPMSVQEARRRASVSADTETAAEAVAEARGIKVSHALERRGDLVKDTLTAARAAVDRDPSIALEDAARAAAENAATAEESRRRQRDRAKARHTARYIEAESRIAKARAELYRAIREIHDVDLDDEERDLLTDSIAGVRAMLALADSAITGESGVDWDAELANLNS